MGVVYAAFDEVLGRLVALKITGTATRTPDSIARLQKEARILAQLEHPNIIPVHDVGLLPDGRSYYTMKLVQGRRLDEHVLNGLPLPERLHIFERVCDAVACAHNHGVIHRDLKPTNIMVGPFGEVLVLDWGVAKTGPDGPGKIPVGPGGPAGPDTTGAGTIIGTDGFMSPEQAVGDPDVDARSDVYALGAVLRVLLAAPEPTRPGGSSPSGRTRRILSAIVNRASASDAGARYQSVLELSAELVRYRDGQPVRAYQESPVERILRVAERYRLPLALILAYVLMRIALLLARPI